MDYEKKYKEALRKARQLCAYPTTKPFINDLQDLFPELNESEDEKNEKVRIGLIKAFNTVGKSKWGGLNVQDILAWLEKQGDKDKLIQELGEYKTKYTQEVLSQQLEKQGEQKSVGNLTPQEAMDIAVAKCFDEQKPADEEMIEALRTEYEKGRADTIAEMKTAWSEEDEKMCQETINWFEKKCFPYALESENPARESIKWLKSLRPQNRWKPNEEQMEALRIAAEVGTANNSWAMGILKGMYNELKSM